MQWCDFLAKADKIRLKAVLPSAQTLEITETDEDEACIIRVHKMILYEHTFGGISLLFYDSIFDVPPIEALEFDTIDDTIAWIRERLDVDQHGWHPIPDPLPRTFYTRECPMRSVWTPHGSKVTIPDEAPSGSPFEAAMLQMKQLLANLHQDTFEAIAPLIHQEQFGKAEIIVQQAMGITWREAKCVIEMLIPDVIGRDHLTLE